MNKQQNGKTVLITGGSRGMAQQSPSVWPRTARTWPSGTRRTRRSKGAGFLLRIRLREDHFSICIQGEQNESPL